MWEYVRFLFSMRGYIAIWEEEEMDECPLCWSELDEEKRYCLSCDVIWTKCWCGGSLFVTRSPIVMACIDCCRIFDPEQKDPVVKCCCGRRIIIDNNRKNNRLLVGKYLHFSFIVKCGMIWKVENGV